MNLEQVPMIYWGIALLALLCLIELIWIISLQGKMKKFQKSYVALSTFLDGRSLDQELMGYISRVEEMEADLNQVKGRLGVAEKKLRSSIDRAELVRFNAFENMGSDLSFSLAFLNQEGDGVVLSSINNREESRVYAKPINHGESSYHLSEEEKIAIDKAKETIKV